MFGIHSDNGYRVIIPGVKIKTINYGEKMLMSEFVLEKNSVLPEHNHEYEQTGYLVRGCIELTIDGKSRKMFPGCSWSISKNISHSAIALDDSVAIEVFNPVRQDYTGYIDKDDVFE